jgi:UDP-glucose 4-epimerase
MTDMRGKKVLITGGLGFIGSNLAKRCLELGADVTVYDCLDPKSGGNMHNIHGFKKDLHIELNDVRNFEGISKAITNKEIAFNCAAYTSHPNSMKEPQIDIEVNCRGSINLLEAARRFNPECKIVHVGTSTQIGKMRYKPIDEYHPEFPIDIYSANKTASEKYFLVYAGAYRMRITVVRLANVFGPRSNIKSPDFGFINYFIGLALQDKEISVFGTGEQMRNVTYVADGVGALVGASLSDKTDGEVYFAVSEGQHSVAEIAESIVEGIGKGRVRHIEWPKDREAIEIGDAVISNKKITDALGWAAHHTLKSGLVETRDYYGPCLDKYLG